MGAFILKPKQDAGSGYAASALGVGPDGLLRDSCIEGILNLENRQVTNDAFTKISAVHTVTRQVLSLSLANNRITALAFDESSGALSARPSSAAGRTNSVSEAPSPVPPALLDEDDDLLEREGSVLRSTAPKPLPASTIPLRSSTNWPMLENLDLSGNTELFSYGGLGTVTATLRSLRLANNGIFKVPTEVWGLVNLTKLDLSHNRLLVLPPGISMLTKLNYLKLSHNSLAANSNSSCIPDEMKFCSRLRRLDLSHNKLRELPVNWRVDREHQRRSIMRAAAASSGSGTGSALPSPAIGSMQSKHAQPTSSPQMTSLVGGSGFSKLDPNDGPPTLSLGATHQSTLSAIALAAASTPPVPIKYFDVNRISYIQITQLNLSNNQIDSLSPSIGLLRSLNSLNLGYNKLRSLPTEIALLAELKYLDLRFNQLPSLLTEICQLPRLSKLCLQNNKISGLPYEIRKLKKLTHFFISSNQLVDLPDVISEIRSVRVLKLCNNRLLTIPDSMFRLQKLRLLDLSFNKLTYISPDVCHMPLIEDLRLWGNKITDIPNPILYSDVKKIISYLRATERERCIIANQMRSMQGPRSYSRISSVRSSPRQSRIRAQSATRALSVPEDRRFAPLGFHDDREGDRADGASLMPASSRSVGSAPAGRRGGGGGSMDSGSETEEGFGSDDEFTSMFRAVTASRAESFTNLAGGAGFGGPTGDASRSSSAAGSARRLASRGSPAATGNRGPSPSPRDHVGLVHTTIVQPFQQQSFSLGLGISNTNDAASGRRNSQQAPLHSIRDRTEHDEEEDADNDADVEDAGQQRDSDVLTDLVRRDWKPSGSPRNSELQLPPSRPSNSRSHSASASIDVSLVPTASVPQSQPDKEALMQEWDMQSLAIEQQQTGKGAAARGRIGGFQT